MIPPAIVLDTGFLWDIYGIPRHDGPADDQARKRARGRLRAALERACPFFVPYPVVFETANSIAHVRDAALRKTLASHFVKDVEKSASDGTPWIIIPNNLRLRAMLDHTELLELCRQFRDYFVDRRVGLSDIVVLQQAGQIQSKFISDGNRRPVYIWTSDAWVKEREPNREPLDWLTLNVANDGA